MLIFTFQYFNQISKIHARNWPKFSQQQEDLWAKTNHSIKDPKTNKN